MAAAYAFRPATLADLPMLERWRQAPAVLRWWGAWAHPQAEFEAHLADPAMTLWIVELGGRPFAYAQDYACHAWDPHPFSYLPPGSRGVDQYIGEPDMLGRGHGSAFLRRHCDRLFADGVPAIGTDPHPDNLRAIRAYRKAGFAVASGPIETRWGRAVLMERWPGPTPAAAAA
ncbi:MAG TPA: GNAT family N-acetyltransferase [Allosphingosinicella sp.]|nr:GNAT family N-acetyltransferase [Allosphingosinicella sp.]